MKPTGKLSRAASVTVDHAPRLTRDPAVRCPCCNVAVSDLPTPKTIEPCHVCRRPLMLVRVIGRKRLYRVQNLLDLAGSIYGVATVVLVLSFVFTDMQAKAFARAFTILLFVVGSLLIVDGILGFRTRVDRTWRTTRNGDVARLFGLGKALAGTFALLLVAVGLQL